MPPTQNQRPKTRKMVQCNCQIHCYRWHGDIQDYRGEQVTAATYQNHQRDEADRRREHQAQYNYDHQREFQWNATLLDEVNTLSTTPVVLPDAPLVFVVDPSSRVFEPEVQNDLTHPNHAPFALSRHPSNSRLLDVQTRLSAIYHLMQTDIQDNSDTRNEILESVKTAMAKVVLEKHIQWDKQRYGNSGNHHVNTEIFFYRGRPRSKAYRCAVLVSLVLKHIYATPLRAIRTQLAGLRSMLRLTDVPKHELDQLPSDPCTVSTYYRLQPITQRYVCCPKCNYVYHWNGKHKDELGCNVPSQCFHKLAVDELACEAEMWKARRILGNQTVPAPIKLFTHHPLKYWLGRLLSRPEIEDHIDEARTRNCSNGILDDIWGSPCFQSLKGPDGQPFLPGPESEGRLIFGLSVDSFDPDGVKAASQSLSSTGIWLVLLNLPPHLRYLQENLYVVGIIPGPQKPSKDEINHYVDLVVDNLLEIYHSGIHLSRTYKYSLGRLYRAMLIPLICDMLAARQIIGHSSSPSAHSFCTVCELDQHDIDILDPSKWPKKDFQHQRHYAEMWKAATTVSDREKLFVGSGLRWTPLLRLPYWEPAKFTVIDAMHTLDLGLLSNHCRTLFALDAEATSGDGSCGTPREPVNKRIHTKAHVAQYRRCLEIVVRNGATLERELIDLDRKVLYTFCVDNAITSGSSGIVVGTKLILARSISGWRNNPGYVRPRLDIEEIRKEQMSRLSEEPNRETTPELAADMKNLLPTIKLLLSQSAAKILYSTATKKIYIHICDILQLDYSHIDTSKQHAKQNLQDYIVKEMERDDIHSTVLSQFLPRSNLNTRVVLGKEVMNIVWCEMQKTQTPTWVATAPPNWGTKPRGKLSAAQWRVICTIHLPITLIRIWSEETGRKRLLLDHFMDLVCAVRIANMKTTSDAQIAAYDKHIFRYVSNICTIYPDQKLKPTHHCALHIGHFLRYMGPTHSHNSPFFERSIGSFHDTNTNLHPSERDTTLLVSAACSSNLRGLLADDKEVLPLVCDMVGTMKQIDREDIRGFRLASILDPNNPTTTSGLKGRPVELSYNRQSLWRECLEICGRSSIEVVPMVLSFPRVSLRGVSYSASDHLTRNSTIMFTEFESRPSPSTMTYQDFKAAFIELIFQPHSPSNPSRFYLLIRELVPVVETGDLRDPYRRYGFAGGFLCRQNHEILRIITLEQIQAHATLTRMHITGFGEVYHVLCVDRMMSVFSSFDYNTDTL